jgi:hypothetical protein
VCGRECEICAAVGLWSRKRPAMPPAFTHGCRCLCLSEVLQRCVSAFCSCHFQLLLPPPPAKQLSGHVWHVCVQVGC